jgi:hypothetical protein
MDPIIAKLVSNVRLENIKLFEHIIKAFIEVKIYR